MWSPARVVTSVKARSRSRSRIASTGYTCARLAHLVIIITGSARQTLRQTGAARAPRSLPAHPFASTCNGPRAALLRRYGPTRLGVGARIPPAPRRRVVHEEERFDCTGAEAPPGPQATEPLQVHVLRHADREGVIAVRSEP